MPELHFQFESAAAITLPSGPALSLRLLITNATADEVVRSIALTTQVQIEPARRRYTDNEKCALADLFGEPARWSSTVRPLVWTTVNAVVPEFTTATHFDLPVPPPEPGFAAERYLHAIDDGEVPLALLFSGRALYVHSSRLQMAPIPWSQETSVRIPAQLCRRLIGEQRYAQRGAP